MKRVIMAAMLLVSTVSVFAADVKSEDRKIETKTEIKKTWEKEDECSLTLTATLGPSWGNVTVTCKGTSTTCRAAVVIAMNCIEEAKKAIMK